MSYSYFSRLGKDFPKIEIEDDTLGQAKVGLGQYSSRFLDYLQEQTRMDLKDWIDVDSRDMGRLCRLPNTIHPGATKSFGEDRYCVPVSIEELATITPDEYIELSREPRQVPESCRRFPSEKAGNVITQYIRDSKATSGSGTSTYDPEAVEKYQDSVNEKIELSDLAFLSSDKPCIEAFRERDDMFNHGSASHAMELNVIAFLTNRNVPIPVILEYFDTVPDYDEDETMARISAVLKRDFSEWNCESVWQQADEFCLGDSCKIFREDYNCIELAE